MTPPLMPILINKLVKTWLIEIHAVLETLDGMFGTQ